LCETEDARRRCMDGAAGVAGFGVDADLANLVYHRKRRRRRCRLAVAGEVLEDGNGGILDDGADDDSPPRGITRSMYLSSLRRWGTRAAVGVIDELDGSRKVLMLSAEC